MRRKVGLYKNFVIAVYIPVSYTHLLVFYFPLYRTTIKETVVRICNTVNCDCDSNVYPTIVCDLCTMEAITPT